ncbi:putative uncharacterized protein ENSP00000383309 [Mangifera indica]|uniref:putative uncharacterized protein ENSP00000383309 n=1 Tax=Mangifera indica TaxID=29780 RepID=UPI001CF976EB|nr:putative uncharacterized protein ENSP00000383309 [Mangifera indica]XP_044468369.1 putative uncharacterized protein ENSP00000383309 [Mangifera indica]
MAEENADLPVTPEGTQSDGGAARRNASSSESGEKVLSRYLRASTGSCHDLCKYGRKHEFEAKARHPMAKRITKPSIDNQIPTASMIFLEKKKTLVARPKSSPTLKSYSSDTPETIKHEVPTRSLVGQNLLSTSTDSHNPVKGEVLHGIKNISASKLRPSPTSKSCLSESQKFNTQELSASAKTEASSKPVKSNSKEKIASPKHAFSLKLKSLVQKPLSSPDFSGGLSGGRNSDIKTGPPKASVKKVIASPRLSFTSPRASLSPKSSKSRVAKKVLASPIVSQPSPRASLSLKPAISRVAKKAMTSPRVSQPSPRAPLSPKPSISRVAKKVLGSSRVSLASPRASFSPRPVLSRVASLNTRKLKSLKVVSPMKNQGHTKPSISRVSKKVLGSSRFSLASPRASFSPRPALSRVASLNTRKHKSLKVLSPVKNQGQTRTDESKESKIDLKHTNDDLVQEKTLYVIQMETKHRSLESDQNESCVVEPALPPSCSLTESLPASSSSSSLPTEEQQEISEYTETGTEDAPLSESDETFSTEEEETMEDEQPGRSRKDGIVYSEEKSSEAIKLHFRRGKVVDVQSDNNSPRRLKFRRGRVLGENPNLKGDNRRILKKKEIDGVAIDSKSSSQKVVLRHQDVQGKKDSQILFNNVIEQTASKLAETRKSKVKALVGAFETVISLQETKPSANTA